MTDKNIIQDKIISQQYIDIIEENSSNYRLSEIFEDSYSLWLNDVTSIIYVNEGEAEKIFPSAEMFSIFPRCYSLLGENESGILNNRLFDYLALEKNGISEVQRSPLNLTGKGSILAIIGPGIDYQNPLFRRSDGSSRILAIWDQALQDGKMPEDFPYGTEFLNEDINRALEQNNGLHHKDESGFGTWLTALIAGQMEDDSVFMSAAPDADIVVVKLKEAKTYLKNLYCISDVKVYQENDIMTALSYVSRFIKVAARPVVAFCPLGTAMGNHAGDGSLDRYVSQLLERRNFFVVWGSGDEGNSRRHFEGKFEVGDSKIQDVEVSVPEGYKDFMLEFWAEKPATFRIAVRSPGGESTGFIYGKKVDWRIFDFVYGEGELTFTYLLSEDQSGWQAAHIRFLKPMEGIWTIRIEDLDLGIESKYHMWLPMTTMLKENVFFPVSSPYCTLTNPVSNRGLMSVCNYNAESESFAPNCSRGYPLSGVIMPDLSATGEKVITLLGEQSSSVISAAYVAGAACQMFEWGIMQKNDILLDGNEIKQYLIRGAERKTDLEYPNPSWGYGTLNLSMTFMKIAGIL